MAEKKEKPLTPAQRAEKRMAKTPNIRLSQSWSTSSLVVDQLLGGGIPDDGMIFIWGVPNSGKTTLLYLIMAQMIREGKRPLYVPTEKWDLRYLLNAIGLPHNINKEELLKYIWIYATNNQEDAASIMLEAAEYGKHPDYKVDAILLDSISSFVPSAYARDIVDPAFGGASKGNNSILRKIYGFTSHNHMPFIFTGQVRQDITKTYYSLTVPGGFKAMQHASSIALQCKSTKISKLKDQVDEDVQLAYQMDITVMRSGKIGCYGGSKAYPVILVTDSIPKIDVGAEIMDIGDQYGIFYDKDNNLLVGKVNALTTRFHNGQKLGNYQQCRETINNDPNLAEELYELVRQAIMRGNRVVPVGIPNSFEDIDNVDVEGEF